MSSFDRDKAFVLIQAQLHEYEAGRGFGVDELVEQLEGCVPASDGVTIGRGEARRLVSLINWVHGSGEMPSPRFTDDEMMALVRTLRPAS